MVGAMEQIDRVRQAIAVLLFIALSSFAILNVWHPLVPMQERALFALIGMGAFFLMSRPATPCGVAADTVHLALTILVFGYTVVFWRDQLDRQGAPITIDLIYGSIGVYLILVATIRSLGRSLAIVVAAFLLYTFLASICPFGWAAIAAFRSNASSRSSIPMRTAFSASPSMRR